MNQLSSIVHIAIIIISCCLQVSFADLPSCDRARCLHCEIGLVLKVCPNTCSRCNHKQSQVDQQKRIYAPTKDNEKNRGIVAPPPAPLNQTTTVVNLLQQPVQHAAAAAVIPTIVYHSPFPSIFPSITAPPIIAYPQPIFALAAPVHTAAAAAPMFSGVAGFQPPPPPAPAPPPQSPHLVYGVETQRQPSKAARPVTRRPSSIARTIAPPLPSIFNELLKRYNLPTIATATPPPFSYPTAPAVTGPPAIFTFPTFPTHFPTHPPPFTYPPTTILPPTPPPPSPAPSVSPPVSISPSPSSQQLPTTAVSDPIGHILGALSHSSALQSVPSSAVIRAPPPRAKVHNPRIDDNQVIITSLPSIDSKPSYIDKYTSTNWPNHQIDGIAAVHPLVKQQQQKQIVDRGTAVRPNVNGNRRNIITATQINRPKPSSSSFIPKNSKQTSISITTVAQKQCPSQPGWKPCIAKDEANFRFQSCCAPLGEGCQSLCLYDASLTTIQVAVLTGRCPISRVSDVIRCASGNEDATSCCEAYGVFAADFEHCRPYCNPSAGLPASGTPSQQYKCLSKLREMQNCFYVSQRPSTHR